MKYFCRIENIRTSLHEFLVVFAPLEIGTIIGWGADELEPDGIAKWKVQSCEEYGDYPA